MILGLAGQAGVGKTTLARHLVDEFSYTRLSFAAVIRRMLTALGVPESYLTDHKNVKIPRLGKTGRYLMQTLGSEFLRDTVNKNTLIYHMDDQLAPYKNSRLNVVIDDVRFDNEAEYVRWHGGKIFNITRGSTQQNPYEDHVSEDGISSELVDFNIDGGQAVADAIQNMEKEMKCLTA